MAMEVVAAMPPSPTRLGDYFFSAPTSPSRLSDFYGPADPPAVDDDDDFAFEFREDLERTSLSADELFVGGVIRPLGKPPPPAPAPSPARGRSPAAAEDLAPSGSGRRAARSLSPPPKQQRQQMIVVPTKPPSASAAAASSKKKSSSSSSSWRLRDFLLFRSASEGRAAEKDPLRKYYAPAAASGRKGRTREVSAHEVHYTANKAVSEGLKKKTFLPYKQGILGRLAFNPALHAIANGFGSLTRP